MSFSGQWRMNMLHIIIGTSVLVFNDNLKGGFKIGSNGHDGAFWQK